LIVENAYELLKTAGIDFNRLAVDGIERAHFGKALLASNLINNTDLTWIAFNGMYDFAYLLSILIG
jgi:hypothetical protein